ncbi:hypothetical protein NM688_g3508 [Phlebia brevispora]|uniref:Uncharacterized protein n=1 Tax=Phlebia brevispora TaxID=194682 RepID=A0ACC1T5C1_9APHY|nr:hypothetical protein NM688_g3508 [Phlebia brevispora]
MPSEYDVILAGGGTASCVIAGRLADADPSLKILVVEAGPHTLNEPAHVQPARFGTHLVPGSKTMTFHVTAPEEAMGGRRSVVPCAQAVGGGSTVNFMMYTRTSASDFDDWEKFDNPGWGSKDLIPLVKKSETYQVAPGKDTHGYSGPLKVSYGSFFTNIGRDFLDIAPKYDTSRGMTEDPNTMHAEGINRDGRSAWVDAETGTRSDTAHYYLYKKNHSNVTIITGHLVKRVVFEYKRAVGIEYVENPRMYPNTTGEVTFVRARRLVVVSAGSLGSPGVLERSGIGAKSVLEKCGVKPIADLPGVDHNILFNACVASEDSQTLDPIVRQTEPEYSKWNEQWLKDGTGLMTNNSVDAGIRLRPDERELEQIGPEFTETWNELYANAPDKPVMWMGVISMLVGDILNAPIGKYFSSSYYLAYPSARGFVHITSDDPAVLPHFETGYLKHADDVALLRWAYKRSREISRRMPCYRGEYAPWHPKFPEGSAAAAGLDVRPVAVDAPDLLYTAEDDKAIEQHMKEYLNTTWHALGTCAMKPREQGGVVDPRLNVYGVEGLKVADCSIPPSNVGTNTYSTTLAIAEKAAVLIAEDLGIQVV